MKTKPLYYIRATLVVLLLFTLLQGCRKQKEILKLPTNKEMITWNDSITFKSDPFSKRVKSVVYLRSDGISEIKRWIPYIKKYPEVGFIFYFSTSDKDYIIGGLKHFDFPIPAYIDTENDYKEYLLIAFIVDENNKIVKLSNPSMPDFDKTLKKMSSALN